MSLYLRYLAFILCFFSAYTSVCQSGYSVLEGKIIIKDGDKFKYQLFLKEKRGKITGYSLTWLQGNDAPNKTALKGKLDKEHKMLYFSESESVNYKDSNMCYIQGIVNYHSKDDKLVFSGVFKGKDKDGVYCGEGMLAFTGNAIGDELFQIELPPSPPLPVEKKDLVPVKELVGEIIQVTPETDRTINWLSDSCTVDIWNYIKTDSDVVNVFFNGKEVQKELVVTPSKNRLSLALRIGENELMITAVNEGHNPPNIARLTLIDGKKEYQFTATENEGKSAVIKLLKK